MRNSSAHSVSRLLIAIAPLLLLRGILAQDPATAPAQHFDYKADAPLNVTELSAQQREDVIIRDITYLGASGDLVPAYLVAPKRPGKYAGILWGHWLMPNSPTANREEFLNEAVALAPAGVVSLLIDAPQARPGFKPAPNAVLTAEQVKDLRRGVDLLLSRSDVDPKRLAYVGHSWDASAGAILDAVDKRVAAFVFMSGPQSNRQYVLLSDSPRMVSARKGVDMTKVEQSMQTNTWADPGTYTTDLGPAPALFQYGLKDEEWTPLQDAKDYFAASSGPKEVKFYDCGHALNAQARLDRFQFLRKELALDPVPSKTLDRIPQVQ